MQPKIMQTGHAAQPGAGPQNTTAAGTPSAQSAQSTNNPGISSITGTAGPQNTSAARTPSSPSAADAPSANNPGTPSTQRASNPDIANTTSAPSAPNNAKRNAMLLMALCGVMWSLGGIFIKLITWSPLLIAGTRSIIAAAVLGLYMIHKKVPIKICRWSIGAGIGLSASCTFFVMANKLTTAANAIVLQYAAPVFILLISAFFFKQKLRRKEVITVAVTMIGIVLFFLDQLSPGSLLGNFFGILAGIFLAVMLVMVGQGGKDDSIRMTGILLAHCLTAIIGTPVGLMTTTAATGQEILYILILGIFQLGIPYVLFAIATRDCPPLACSLIAMLEPLLNPVWVAIFVGEMPGTIALIGAAIIIATVTWWCITDSRPDTPQPPG